MLVALAPLLLVVATTAEAPRVLVDAATDAALRRNLMAEGVLYYVASKLLAGLVFCAENV